MPDVKVSVPFQIQQDEALNRVKARLTEIKSQYGNMVSNLTENWNGYVGTFSARLAAFRYLALLPWTLQKPPFGGAQ
jgi:hypothetical protein